MITLVKSVINLIYKGIMVFVNALTSFLLYFGLYIPFIYLVYTSLLMIFGNLSLKTFSLQSMMFYIGLIICIICSLIITYRRLKGPQDNYKEDYIDTRPPRRNYKRNDNYYRQRYNDRPYDRYNDRNNNRYNDYNNRNDYGRYNNNANYDVPIVRRHSRYPGIVLYEYSNRIEYYGDNGRKQLVYLRTQYKR